MLCALALRACGTGLAGCGVSRFAALSTGAFTRRQRRPFHSVAVELVLVLFMLLAAVNFATHFLAWRGKSLRALSARCRARSFAAVARVQHRWLCGLPELAERAFFLDRTAAWLAFNTVSIATDCGFASVDFDQWPIFRAAVDAVPVLHYRVLWLDRRRHQDDPYLAAGPVQASREMVGLLHPAAVQPVRIGGAIIPNAVGGIGARFHLSVFHEHRGADLCVLVGSGLGFISAFTGVIAQNNNNAGPGLYQQLGPAENPYGSLERFRSGCTALPYCWAGWRCSPWLIL